MVERAAQAKTVRGDRSRVKLSKPIDALLRAHARKRAFKRGAVVVADGEPAGGLWCVETGAIAVSGRSAGQRDFIFRFRQPGEWFGETTLLDGLPWVYTHVASVKTTALHVPHREAQRLMALHPELRNELVRVTCARLRATAEYVEEIIVPDLPARLAYHLLVIGRANCAERLPSNAGQCCAPGIISFSAAIIWQPLHEPRAKVSGRRKNRSNSARAAA